ncbi:hypothetical protein GF324_08330 [bacterium]|nr:hypothetical protein [bacterium]
MKSSMFRVMAVWVVLLGLSAHTAYAGTGKFVYVFKDKKYTAQLNEKSLKPDGSGNAAVSIEQGVYNLDVFKGTPSPANRVMQLPIFIPAGYTIQAYYTDGGLVVSSAEVHDAAAATSGMMQDVQVHMQVQESGHSTSTQVTAGGMGMTVQVQETGTMSESAPMQQPVEEKRPSKITFLSEEGMCEIYWDGKLVIDMDMGDIDEMARGVISDIEPGTYHLKIEHFMDEWYNDKFKVGSGEHIKIRIDPGTFDVIARDEL